MPTGEPSTTSHAMTSADDKEARFQESQRRAQAATSDHQVRDDRTVQAQLRDTGNKLCGTAIVGMGYEWRHLTTEKGTKLWERQDGTKPLVYLRQAVRAVSPMPVLE